MSAPAPVVRSSCCLTTQQCSPGGGAPPNILAPACQYGLLWELIAWVLTAVINHCVGHWLQVVRTRNSASIYRPTCIANLINAALWVAYGVVSAASAVQSAVHQQLTRTAQHSDLLPAELLLTDDLGYSGLITL